MFTIIRRLVLDALGAGVAFATASSLTSKSADAQASTTCSLQSTWKGEVVAEKDRDYATTRSSVAGRYRLSIHPRDDSIPRNRVHAWVLHIEDLQGAPVDSASICIDGGMPEHGHGLPTRPRVTEALKNGDYLVDGMKFSMAGWWVVKFTVATSTGADSVRFNLKLP